MKKIFNETNSINQVKKKTNLESYEKPSSELIPLLSEGMICSSMGGNAPDPEEGEGGYWPGFSSERAF